MGKGGWLNGLQCLVGVYGSLFDIMITFSFSFFVNTGVIYVLGTFFSQGPQGHRVVCSAELFIVPLTMMLVVPLPKWRESLNYQAKSPSH